MNKSLRLKASFVAASLVVSIAYPLSTMALVGNGAPSGTHYNLNIIGVPKGKSATMTSGNRIFVNLTGKTTIKLSSGDFAVLDGNGTDGTASFQLPNPDPDGNGETIYSVYARALGKPGGSAKVVTCALDALDPTITICSTESYVASREKGKSSFTNVSRQLLYIYEDINADGKKELVPLFDSRLQGYFWEYDNTGLKVLQLRFYPISTNVN